MDDIYEDIVRVGNNLDTLNIKREELQNQPDLNQNRNLSQVQPIPMHVSYKRVPKLSAFFTQKSLEFMFYGWVYEFFVIMQKKMPWIADLFPKYSRFSHTIHAFHKRFKVNEVFIQSHLMSARHDPLGRSLKFGVILVVIDFWRENLDFIFLKLITALFQWFTL